MKKKKAVRRINFPAVIFGLSVTVFLLIVYLAQAADKLVKIQAANAEAAAQVVLPVAPVNAGSCGT